MENSRFSLVIEDTLNRSSRTSGNSGETDPNENAIQDALRPLGYRVVDLVVPDLTGEIPLGVLASLDSAGASSLQRELIRRCSQLGPEQLMELFGSLSRMMLEPKANYWEALHRAIEITETGCLMPGSVN